MRPLTESLRDAKISLTRRALLRTNPAGLEKFQDSPDPAQLMLHSASARAQSSYSGLQRHSASVHQHSRTSWILPFCISHAAAALGKRSWEFGVGLLLLHLSSQKQELRLTAILVLAECGLCSLLGPHVGQWVDRTDFLRAATHMLAVQSLGIAAAGAFLAWTLADTDFSIQQWHAIPSIAFSVLARLGSLGFTIATEKRWATALALHVECEDRRLNSPNEIAQDSKEDKEGTRLSSNLNCSKVLSQLNARLRCIDLLCSLCAPIVSGFLLDYATPAKAALGLAGFSLLAWPAATWCLLWIYYHHPSAFTLEDDKTVFEAQDKTPSLSLFHGWRLYFAQPYFKPFLALALLYLSVIGFGSLMTAWLAASGLRTGFIGIARALSAVPGLAATVAAPRAMEAFGLEGAGTRFIWWMWVCLLPTAIAALHSSHAGSGLWVVVLGVILSRFGLWGFDLAVSQLLQERVSPPEEVGALNGAQTALQNAFEALAALLCTLFADPASFGWLILGSFGSVSTATLLHTSFPPPPRPTSSSSPAAIQLAPHPHREPLDEEPLLPAPSPHPVPGAPEAVDRR